MSTALEVPESGVAIEVRDLMDAIALEPEHQVGNFCPLVHRFAPGVYAREITMPADTMIVGKKHRTRHLNIISKGRVSFWMQGEPAVTVEAPYTFISGAGVQKVLYVHEETVWTTIHPTDETDIATLETALIESTAEPTVEVLP